MNKIKLFFGLAALMVAVAFTSCGETANNIKEKAKDAAAATTDAAKGAAAATGAAVGTVAGAAAGAAGAAAAAAGTVAGKVVDGAKDAAKATGDAAGKVVDGAKGMAKDAAKAVTGKKGPEYTSKYICPMHCEGSGAAEAGKCPACKMDYVVNEHFGHNH